MYRDTVETTDPHYLSKEIRRIANGLPRVKVEGGTKMSSETYELGEIATSVAALESLIIQMSKIVDPTTNE